MIFSDSKVQLSKSRVKTIKLRGVFSQGLVIPVDKIFEFMHEKQERISPAQNPIQIPIEGRDITNRLGITKYEPKRPQYQKGQKKSTKYNPNPHFDKYQSLQNIKNYSNAISPDDEVVVTEKLHGTNFRAGWVPTVRNTWWKKLKHIFGFLPPFEFVVGSRNVQLQNKKGSYYGKNIYKDIAKKYDLKNILPKGMIIYGEVIGEGIQKGYDYGAKEHILIIFDIKTYHASGTFQYLEWSHFVKEFRSLKLYGLKCMMAPNLFEGKMKDIPNLFGKSVLCSKQEVIEGIVIWCDNSQLRKLKHINPEYLLKDNTDYH